MGENEIKESVFPSSITEYQMNKYGEAYTVMEGGLTKRELFASMAMQASLVHPDSTMSKAQTAEEAVEYADALIKQLGMEEA